MLQDFSPGTKSCKNQEKIRRRLYRTQDHHKKKARARSRQERRAKVLLHEHNREIREMIAR